MKINSTILLCVACFFGFNLIGTQNLRSDNTSPVQNSSPIFSGNDLKLEDVISKSDAIFVGQLEFIGTPLAKSPGESSYHGVQIKVSQILKGNVDTQISVSLFTKHGKTIEAPPVVGNSYIFFAKKEDGWIVASKLIPATADNISKTTQLIAQIKK